MWILFCFLKNKPLAAIITYTRRRLTVIVLSNTIIVRLLRSVSTIHSNLSSNADPKRVYNCFYFTFLLLQRLLFDDASRLLLYIFPEHYYRIIITTYEIISVCLSVLRNIVMPLCSWLATSSPLLSVHLPFLLLVQLTCASNNHQLTS